jgi:hypothetical protein
MTARFKRKSDNLNCLLIPRAGLKQGTDGAMLAVYVHAVYNHSLVHWLVRRARSASCRQQIT